MSTSDTIDAIATRDRLSELFARLDIATTLGVATVGGRKAITISSLWDVDAEKLANALDAATKDE